MSHTASSEKLHDYGTFVLRIVLGSILAAHALASLVLLSSSAAPPDYLQHLLIVGEALAGVALVLGFQARWAALAAIPVLFVSLWFHAGGGWLFPGAGGGREVPLLLIVIAAVQVLLGDGPFTLARSAPLNLRLRRQRHAEQPAQPAPTA